MDIYVLLQQFCDYSVSILGYSKDTIRRYKFVVKHYCKIAGIREISQASTANVRAMFYYGRTERHWSTNTYVVYRKSLLVFFRWCVKQGYMQENPILDIETPKIEKKLPPKLSKQAALRLLEVVYNYPYEKNFMRFRDHAILSTFIFAGLRRQELLRLKYADVDIDNLTIFIRQGKGGKDRIVPISNTLSNSLKKYIVERTRLNKTNPEFFSSFCTNIGMTDIALKRLVIKIRAASGVSFGVHRLRHTFATLMLEGGCDIFSLSKMMGHSDIKTTTIYLSATAEHLRAQMTKHPLNEAVQAVF